MDKLISDCAKAEMGSRVKDILRALIIQAWHSEPYHQNQNFAENRYNTIKAATNRVLNLSGAPANTWLLALTYVCLLLNHLASPALGWIPPNQKLTGQTQDISMFLQFHFMSQCTTIAMRIRFLPHPMRNRVGGLVLQCMLVIFQHKKY
jgi:hypothetical protein